MTLAPSDLTAPDRHIFLSPHYDDIALSCGGTAAVLSGQGRTPEIALIFGDHPDPHQPMTAFAEEMHRDWGLSATEVIESRRAEERVASMTLGACDRFLPFRDAIYRDARYLSDVQLFGSPHPDDATIPDQIVAELRLSNQDKSRSRIFAPLAIGGHVDHQLAYGAGLNLANSGWDVWFYEDLPYGLKPENRFARREDLEADGVLPITGVDVSSVWSRKIDAIMAYPSQLSTIFEQYVGISSTRSAIDDAMKAYATSAGAGVQAERFWARNG